MTLIQRIVKYGAIALAIALIAGIIGGIVSLISAFGGGYDSGVLDDVKEYKVSQDIKVLKLDIAATALKINVGDSFSVKSNLEKLTVRSGGGVLEVAEKKVIFSGGREDAVLDVTLPENVTLELASVKTGAGTVTVSALKADKVILTLGAGKAVIENLTATEEIEIKSGAGETLINGGSLTELDLDMGVGEMTVKASLYGDCDLDLGVGSANIVIIGSREDYTVKASCGIGKITLDGEKLSDGAVIGNGKNVIDVDGGIGSAKIAFENKD